jgi:hypothetical protein
MTRSVLARSYARSQGRGDREARSTLERWFEDSNVSAPLLVLIFPYPDSWPSRNDDHKKARFAPLIQLAAGKLGQIRR